MIGGQIMDLEAEGKQIDFDRLKTIHRFKTGKMITASILFGGILANGSKASLELLEQFGKKSALLSKSWTTYWMSQQANKNMAKRPINRTANPLMCLF